MLINLLNALRLRCKKQCEVAEAAGISPAYLSAIICGKRKAGPELKKKIAGALGVDEEWAFQQSTAVPAPRIGVTNDRTYCPADTQACRPGRTGQEATV